MRVGMSTAFAGALGGEADLVDQLIDGLARGGAEGVLLDGGLPGDLYEALEARLGTMREELPVWALESPCPATKAASADLAAIDRDEGRAALEAAEETIVRAAEVGADLVAIRLGEVASLKGDWPAIRRAFLRGKLDEEGRERLRRERQKRVVPHLDAARRALDRLARRAEAVGVTLGVRNPARPIGLPSPIELAMLLGELAGAPIVPLLDLPATHVGAAMGMAPVEGIVEAWKGSPLSLIGDACVGVVGLPPGRGEIDVAEAVRALPKDGRVVFHPWRGLERDEILSGFEELRRLTGS